GGAQASGGGVGVREGELSEGASPSFSIGLDNAPAEFNFFLPSGAVSLDITNPGDPDFPDAVQEVGLQGPNFNVSAFNLRVTGTDQLQVGAGGTSLSFRNESGNPLGLKTEVGLADGRSLAVSAVVSGTSTGVTASVDPASGKVDIGAAGSSGSTVTLVVTATDDKGQERTGQLTFVSSGDGGISADTTGWMAGDPLSGTVNNNGSMMMVTNACEDGRRSGMESDVDCGAVCTLKCGVGLRCGAGADCQSTFCNSMTGRCVATSCDDRVRSGDETDVDCGGSCGACAVGLSCARTSDCAGTASCQSGTCRATFAVAVDVTGLPAGSAPLLLQNNGADALTAPTNGRFSFPTRVLGAYAITVQTQPDLATCAVTGGTGTATADVVVAVTCTPTFSVGGSVSGLPAGESVVLANGGDRLTASANGPFTFTTRVSGAYAVTVATQPASATCTVSAGSGTASADVTDVLVVCGSMPQYTIGGTLSGLGAGRSITLANDGEQLPLTMNGAFQFVTPVPGPYNVTISAQPMGQTCAVANGSGTATANVTNVTVVCSGAQGRDTTFGTNGFLRVAPTPDFDAWHALVVNADDSIVLAGFTEASPGVSQWLVSKVTAAGAIDTSFGVNGSRLVTAGAGAEQAEALVRDSMGRYVVVGTLAGATNLDLGVARLTSAGALDTTFGTNGIARFDFGGDEFAEDVAIDSQGRLVVVGHQAGMSGEELVVARLTAAGALDPTFATNGRFLSSTPQPDNLLGVAIDGSDRVVAVGFRDQDSLVLRLTSAGVPDSSFGSMGVFTVDLTTGLFSDRLNAVALDGARIVAAGEGLDSASSNYYLAGFTQAGALDTSFGAGGTTIIGGATANEALTSLVRRPGGGWYAAGFSDGSAAVLRFSAAGAIDTTFSMAGEFRDSYSGTAAAFGVALDGRGRIVIAGPVSVG
ncbi:MAG: hypothetical protein INH37_07315, partial [Myxococcaceae bacterium]|nr:hypothetical protein [Myxococcaceae bacterium]